MSEKILWLIHESGGGRREITFTARHCVIAGWTGRDAATIESHVRELELIGVPRPTEIPTFYRVSTDLITTSERIQVAGKCTSGEVEIVLFVDAQTTYVGVGSDHTDRDLETISVARSKQACSKPICRSVWRLQDVVAHWDKLSLVAQIRSRENGPYQSGRAAELRAPDDILGLYRERVGTLPDGLVMFCGTLPIEGPFHYGSDFTMTLADPVLGRHLQHRYEIESLSATEE